MDYQRIVDTIIQELIEDGVFVSIDKVKLIKKEVYLFIKHLKYKLNNKSKKYLSRPRYRVS